MFARQIKSDRWLSFREAKPQSTIAVQAAYAEWEMSVEPGLIDHLATELEFLAFLASAESLDNAVSADARNSPPI